jgi:hypothetical protein
MTPFWIGTTGPALAQGDLLPECLLPIFQWSPGQPKALPAGNLHPLPQSLKLGLGFLGEAELLVRHGEEGEVFIFCLPAFLPFAPWFRRRARSSF